MYRKNQTFRETQSKPVSKAKHDYATNKLKFEKYKWEPLESLNQNNSKGSYSKARQRWRDREQFQVIGQTLFVYEVGHR